MNQTTGASEVAIFIPCLIDQVYPEMGLAMVEVLERLGYRAVYNPEQTCCGQPAFNAGHRDEAASVAGRCLELFRDARTVVCPSGSCTAMIRNYFPVLLKDGAQAAEAAALGGKIFEFSEFLVRQGALPRISGAYPGRVGFHNSCHSHRELRLHIEPLEVLKRISGCEVVLLDGEPVCCGFGGLFSFKYAPIASTMARSRLELFQGKGVDAIVSNDPGCILHLRQEAAEKGLPVRISHIAELLAQAMKASPS